MASITIRRLDETTKARLRIRAAQHGRSMEEEARQILKLGLAKPKSRAQSLPEFVRARFGRLRGVELPEIRREPDREPPDFSGPEFGE